MLKKSLTAQILPIRILRPAVDHVILTETIEALQQGQTDHHPGCRCRTTILGIKRSKRLVQTVPINSVCEFDQRIGRITNHVQANMKQFALGFLNRFLWSHSFARK